MAKIVGIGAAALAVAMLAGPASARADAFFKGGWWVTCSNLRDCAAFLGDTASGYAFMRMTRGAAAEAPLAIEVFLYTEALGASLGEASVAIDGGPAVSGPLAAEPGVAYARLALAPADTARWVDALANGRELRIETGATDPIKLTLEGSSATMRWMDDRQARAGTVTALVARGDRPASAVPPPPQAPIVAAAPAVAQSDLPAEIPEGVRAYPAVKACLEEEVDSAAGGRKPEFARLTADAVLVSVPCGAGAYNYMTQHVILEKGQVRPIRIGAGREGDDGGLLVNTSFDPATNALSAFSKGRGLADCGVGQVFVFDGRAFQLTDEQTMGQCVGVPPDLWPQTFVAAVTR